ncbi:MAG: hypothetical protein ACLTT1_07190 [[Clostridium] scindens]
MTAVRDPDGTSGNRQDRPAGKPPAGREAVRTGGIARIATAGRPRAAERPSTGEIARSVRREATEGRQSREARARRPDRRNNEQGEATTAIPAPETPAQKPQRSKVKGKDDHKKKEYRREEEDRT